MATDTDLVVKTESFLANTAYLNEGKVKFLQIIKDAIRQTCSEKHEKRCAELYAFWMSPPSPSSVST